MGRAPVKFAICITCYGPTASKFTYSLAEMLSHFLTANITDPEGNPLEREVRTFIVSCSMLTESRHRLVAEALVWGADYLLWCDADHVFPPDALARLWSRNLPVVGCNYPRRFIPTAPTAAKHVSDTDDHQNLVYTTVEKAHDDEVEEVSHLGFGLCLMDMRIFDALQLKADEKDGNFLPLFQFEPREDKIGVIGEDVFFFRKLREAGVKIYVDHALSWEVGHIHEMILTNAHAVKQEDKWKEYWASRGKNIREKIDELEAD